MWRNLNRSAIPALRRGNRSSGSNCIKKPCGSTRETSFQSWRQSRGLEKPKTPPPNDTKWSRKKLDEASTLYIDDVAYWERKYPGYTLNRVKTRVSNAGWRHTTVIMRRAECWHGTPGRKVTPRMNR